MTEGIDINEAYANQIKKLEIMISNAIDNAPLVEIDYSGNAKKLIDEAKDEYERTKTAPSEDSRVTFPGLIEPNQVTIDAKQANLYPKLIKMGLDAIEVPENEQQKLIDGYLREEYGHMNSSYDAEQLTKRYYGIQFFRVKMPDGSQNYGLAPFVKFEGTATIGEYKHIIKGGASHAEISDSDRIKLGEQS